MSTPASGALTMMATLGPTRVTARSAARFGLITLLALSCGSDPAAPVGASGGTGGDAGASDGGRPVDAPGSAGGGALGTGGIGPASGGAVGAGGGAPGSDAAAGGAGATGGSGTPAAGGSGGSGIDAGGNVGDASPAACSVCTSWGQPELLGKVTAAGLGELSGMAASWRNPGVLYVHNDRNRPVVYALDQSAGLLTRLTLGGAVASDIEDIEVSRCPGGTCIFAADIGNNITPREEFSIFRVTEPDVALAAPSADRTLPAERFAFRYADTAHNAESLIIDPVTGAVFIVTKVVAGQPSAAYKLDTFELGKVNVASKIADLPVPKAGDQPATAGSAQPCGAGFLLRTGNTLYEFRIPLGTPFIDAFHATPVVVPAGVEPQSEAVTYQPDGRGYATTSEGANPPIDRVRCQ
jgi:hypothetical protein